MKITVNGEYYDALEDSTVAVLVEKLSITGRFAVELNEEILPRSKFDAQRLASGDHVEIVTAIGGG